jgi:hypothetical protein
MPTLAKLAPREPMIVLATQLVRVLCSKILTQFFTQAADLIRSKKLILLLDTQVLDLSVCKLLTLLVGAAGLEPATTCLEGRCSIHLSYAP